MSISIRSRAALRLGRCSTVHHRIPTSCPTGIISSPPILKSSCQPSLEEICNRPCGMSTSPGPCNKPRNVLNIWISDLFPIITPCFIIAQSPRPLPPSIHPRYPESGDFHTHFNHSNGKCIVIVLGSLCRNTTLLKLYWNPKSLWEGHMNIHSATRSEERLVRS